jgi:hypothetical protein
MVPNPSPPKAATKAAKPSVTAGDAPAISSAVQTMANTTTNPIAAPVISADAMLGCGWETANGFTSGGRVTGEGMAGRLRAGKVLTQPAHFPA